MWGTRAGDGACPQPRWEDGYVQPKPRKVKYNADQDHKKPNPDLDKTDKNIEIRILFRLFKIQLWFHNSSDILNL